MSSIERGKFLEKCRAKYGDTYCYFNFVYVDSRTKSEIVCTKHAEIFYQTPARHLNSIGCKYCLSLKLKAKKNEGKDLWVKEDVLKHVDLKNEVTLVKIGDFETKLRTKITLNCKVHGDFTIIHQKVKDRDTLCRKCSNPTSKIDDNDPNENISWWDLKGLICVKYNIGSETSFICKEHKDKGIQTKKTSDIFRVINACNFCRVEVNSNDLEFKFLEILNEVFKDNPYDHDFRKDYLFGRELDFYSLNYNIGIEVNGLYYHSSKCKKKDYHKNKREYFKSKGIKLIYIWEDEIYKNKDKLVFYLKNLLGLNTNKIDARKCTTEIISWPQAKAIYEKYHLLGAPSNSGVHYGLIYNKEIVCIMSFNKSFGVTQLSRMVNNCNYIVRGGFSKLISAWEKDNPLERFLTSYIDLDKFDGASYLKSGFQIKSTDLRMDYFFKGERVSKFKLRKESFEKTTGIKWDDSLTEKDNCDKNHIYQIWNSGVITVVKPHTSYKTFNNQ
jgi:very-short-patch-repair endonuclease